MKKYSRSIIATGIALALVACNNDSSTSGKENTLPSNVTVPLGEAQITGLVEKSAISNLVGQTETVEIEAFKGIRFASAERFKHSKLTNPTGDIDATEFGAICPQLGNTSIEQSEDCLSLNIWRPARIKQQAKLPVYVFIHGGSFESGAGSSALNQADTIVAQSISDTALGQREEPFIAVTLNYRVGLLGSMWVDAKENPQGGNFGIGDQKRALEWVNKYISQFGGDETNVTVFGESAGAMSIGILQQDSKVAGSYYQRAIMQSNPYGIAYKDYGSAKRLEEQLNAQAQEQFQKSLETLSLDELKEIQAYAKEPMQLMTGLVTSFPATSGFLPFAPYIDKKQGVSEFAFEGNLGKQAIDTDFLVPTVVGYNTDEANIFTSMLDWMFLYNIQKVDPETGEVNPLFLKNLSYTDTFDISKIKSKLKIVLTALIVDNLFNPEKRKHYEALLEEVTALPDDVVKRQNLYPIITRLFLGLQNLTASNALEFSDYAAYDDKTLTGNGVEGDKGALGNIGQIRKLANDLLFTCAAREVVNKQPSNNATTLYHYDYTSSINIWPFGHGTMGNLAALSCSNSDGTGKACHASELPFVFNKAVNIAGEKIYPNKQDRELMNTMSRVWFTDALFDDYQRNSTDNVLMINADGQFVEQVDWDSTMNVPKDSRLGNSICDGITEQGILFDYFPK
ncbi:carboxylesterase family protein [Photobacterium rosenbergii]|uniref:carboxylesterase family protein n=1 Tax=Photobacterium rosenbergii TaxID=294936 RepID=UPI001C996BC9|nr:carboxylesterase family protein [Photobacterium rosenbergii]MBY5943973.1 carboxylesterase family protein [Photobacterium rosenbergii]